VTLTLRAESLGYLANDPEAPGTVPRLYLADPMTGARYSWTDERAREIPIGEVIRLTALAGAPHPATGRRPLRLVRILTDLDAVERERARAEAARIAAIEAAARRRDESTRKRASRRQRTTAEPSDAERVLEPPDQFWEDPRPARARRSLARAAVAGRRLDQALRELGDPNA
jgi:hypothetical protein